MRTRTILGFGAIAAALPYLTLKTLWVTGHPVGINDTALLESTTMLVANLVTAGMEAVGVLLALALTQRWGMRLPAWLVLFPMWVATGLLAPIAIGFPLTELFTDPIATVTSDALQPWVYLVVYGGFGAQCLALVGTFALYVRDRWGAVLRGRVEPGATHVLQVLLARVASVPVLLIAAAQFYWAFGGTWGVETSLQNPTQQILRGVEGALTVAGGVGLWMIVAGRGRFAVGAALAWVGAGQLFGGGLWMLAASSALQKTGGIGATLDAVKLVTAILIGLLAAFLLVERAATVTAAQPAAPVSAPARTLRAA